MAALIPSNLHHQHKLDPSVSFPNYLLSNILAVGHFQFDLASLKEIRRVCSDWCQTANAIFFRKIIISPDNTDQFLKWAGVDEHESSASSKHPINNDVGLSSSTINEVVDFIHFVKLEYGQHSSATKLLAWAPRLYKALMVCSNLNGVFYPWLFPRVYEPLGISSVLMAKRDTLTHLDLFPYLDDLQDEYDSFNDFHGDISKIANKILVDSEPFSNLSVVKMDLSNADVTRFDLHCLKKLGNVKTIIISANDFIGRNIPPRLLQDVLSSLPSSLERLRLTLHPSLVNGVKEECDHPVPPKPLNNLFSLELIVLRTGEYEFATTSQDHGLEEVTQESFATGLSNMFRWFMPSLRRVSLKTSQLTAVYELDNENHMTDLFLHTIASIMYASDILPHLSPEIQQRPLQLTIEDCYRNLHHLQLYHRPGKTDRGGGSAVAVIHLVDALLSGTEWAPNFKSLSLVSPKLTPQTYLVESKLYVLKLCGLLQRRNFISYLDCCVFVDNSYMVNHLSKVVHDNCNHLRAVNITWVRRDDDLKWDDGVIKVMKDFIDGLPSTVKWLSVVGLKQQTVRVECMRIAMDRGIEVEWGHAQDPFKTITYPWWQS
ncbi:hypothetical protein HDU76_006718 [Blyttiomyces sp. JEL0837]|nr:hypothetical protein HDU76_006718 [Blyttiomyces sp. JEL0837]